MFRVEANNYSLNASIIEVKKLGHSTDFEPSAALALPRSGYAKAMQAG